MTLVPPNLDKVVVREVGITLALLDAEVAQIMFLGISMSSKVCRVINLSY